MEFLQPVVNVIMWLYGNYAAILGAVSAVIMLIIPLFQLIPGDQPEALLQKIVDWIAKYSKK